MRLEEEKKKSKVIVGILYAVVIAAILAIIVSVSYARYETYLRGYTQFQLAGFNAVVLGEFPTEGSAKIDEYRLGLNVDTSKLYPGVGMDDDHPALYIPFVVANGSTLFNNADLNINYTIKMRTTGNIPLEYELEKITYTKTEVAGVETVEVDVQSTYKANGGYKVDLGPTDPELDQSVYEYLFYKKTGDDEHPLEDNVTTFVLNYTSELAVDTYRLKVTWPIDEEHTADDPKYIKEVDTIELIVTASSGFEELPSVIPLPTPGVDIDRDDTLGVIMIAPSEGKLSPKHKMDFEFDNDNVIIRRKHVKIQTEEEKEENPFDPDALRLNPTEGNRRSENLIDIYDHEHSVDFRAFYLKTITVPVEEPEITPAPDATPAPEPEEAIVYNFEINNKNNVYKYNYTYQNGKKILKDRINWFTPDQKYVDYSIKIMVPWDGETADLTYSLYVTNADGSYTPLYIMPTDEFRIYSYTEEGYMSEDYTVFPENPALDPNDPANEDKVCFRVFSFKFTEAEEDKTEATFKFDNTRTSSAAEIVTDNPQSAEFQLRLGGKIHPTSLESGKIVVDTSEENEIKVDTLYRDYKEDRKVGSANDILDKFAYAKNVKILVEATYYDYPPMPEIPEPEPTPEP